MKKLAIVILCLGLVLTGCSDIRDMTRKKALLEQLVKTNASESFVREQLPLKWSVHEKGSPNGDEFGDSLLRKTSSDLQKPKDHWRSCDRALWHTTESVVTIVFIKTNVATSYYIGVQ
jgi:hypothetical protein